MVERKGYKQTEIGIIPEDWGLVEIGNYINVNTGSKNTQDKIDGGHYPFYVRSQNVENIDTYSFDCEAVLTAGDGVGTGKIFHHINGKFEVHQRVYIMNGFGERLDGKYFFYYFSNNFYNRIMQMTAKSSVDSVRKEMITEMQITIPSLPEQTAIATVLSDMDEYILSLERLIAKKKAIKQGTMQNLLTGKIRLKGFKGEWVERKLGEIAEIKDGTHQTPKYTNDGIPFYSVENVTNNDFKNTKSISVEEHKTLTKSYKIEMGDILMTRIGSIGVCKLVDWSVEASFYVSLALLKFKKGYLSEFFTHYSNTNVFIEEIEAHSLQHAIPKKINLGNISHVKVFFPNSEKEQTTIATILSDMDTEIEALQAKLSKAKLVKQGAMQELLTGKIRLNISQTQSIEKPQKQTNVHFKRSVWAAEIADRLCNEPTFGHVKMEKLLFLTENLCEIDIGSNYHRDAAGPYDNRAIRSIDSQLKKQNWFEVVRQDKGYRYIPLVKRGGHKDYFNKYYSDILPVFDKVINTLRNWDTERCEIVATLYSAWKDLTNTTQQYTDDDIINEVLNNWHESKKRIPKERWQKALDWMRKNDFTPIKI